MDGPRPRRAAHYNGTPCQSCFGHSSEGSVLLMAHMDEIDAPIASHRIYDGVERVPDYPVAPSYAGTDQHLP